MVAPQPPSSLTSLIHHAASHTESPISAEALSTKQVASYIRSLSNFSLSDLRNQPQQLGTKSEALHQQLSELCISQTDAFIDIHQAEQQFAPSLDTFATHLADLINNTLPDLHKAVDAFADASKPVLDQRQRVQNVADQYERGHLSDLLEIPSLVHTCVQAAHYSEAIQLTEHLTALLKPTSVATSKTKADSEYVQAGQRSIYLSLLLETLSHLANMKADLIESFSRTGLKLPAARKSITVLRKLNHVCSLLSQIPDCNTLVQSSPQSSALIPELGLTENQLCLAFLKARIRSFHSALDAIGSPSSFSSETYLRRYIDLWREEMADSLSMVFSLFIDDAPSSQTQPESSKSEMVTPSFLISSFAHSGFERLRDTVSLQLVSATNRVRSSSDSGSLETLAELYNNVHTQLSYASASLSRFGFDFGKLLLAPSPLSTQSLATASLSTIESTWLEALSYSLDQSFAWLNDQLDHHLTAADGSLPSRWLLSSQLPESAIKDLYTPSSHAGDEGDYADLSRPNIELVDYPLLAKLLNRLLEWINAIQVFAPTSLGVVLLEKLDRHCAKISERLLEGVPATITKLQHDTPYADRLLVDQQTRTILEHIEDPDSRNALQTELARNRESVILSKVLRMWHQSVASWTLRVVQTQVFDLKDEEAGKSSAEVRGKAEHWIQETAARVREEEKRRMGEAKERKRVVEEATAMAEVRARQREEERKRVEEEARRKAEAKAKAKAEAEAKAKAEEEARKQAEADSKAKVEEEARIKAQEERKKAEEEEEARKKAEAEEKAKDEAQAQAKAEAEAEAARVKAEDEAEAKAEAEAEAKAQAEAEAAEAKAQEKEEAARIKAEEEAVKAKTEAEAEEEKRKAEAKIKAEEETSKPREAAEAARENTTKALEQATASGAASKKFSLAEKLRLRKEERDRAAASDDDSNEAPTTEDSTMAEAAKEAAPEATSTKDESARDTAQTEEVQKAEEAKDEAAAEPNEKAEMAKEPKSTEGNQESEEQGADDKADDEGADDDEGEEDKASGANTPTTPATLTTPNLGGRGSKKNKNKNKKK
ncbi:uncharacterized protein UBRO_05042 [Ustilago bromivora]|uniref:Conserved oligomeric Golgi complex subunit 8 n=1 Tax=Ustilago bromivora TaxID=307758 RepID=A0A1K0G5J4_9BASI|nr:uncharacterized protein UBRO_05042 [Ustilago bromivora]SYW82790.1 uncharacterized protein UBRO2_04912 [Ustilago bromivora]